MQKKLAKHLNRWIDSEPPARPVLLVTNRPISLVHHAYEIQVASWDDLRANYPVEDFGEFVFDIHDSLQTQDFAGFISAFTLDRMQRLLAIDSHFVLLGNLRKTTTLSKILEDYDGNTSSTGWQLFEWFRVKPTYRSVHSKKLQLDESASGLLCLAEALSPVDEVIENIEYHSDADTDKHSSRGQHSVKSLAFNGTNSTVIGVVSLLRSDSDEYDPFNERPKTIWEPNGTIALLPRLPMESSVCFNALVDHLFAGAKLTAPEATSNQPTWVSALMTPREEQLRLAAARIQVSIDESVAARQKLVDQANESRWPIDLLYQTGNAFAKAASRALSELGLEVEELFEGAKTDAVARLPGKEQRFLAIEYKGLKRNSVDVKDVRQAAEWALRTKHEKSSKKVKAVVIANCTRLSPLAGRAQNSPDDVNKTAKFCSVAILRAEDLYLLYMHSQGKKRLLNRIWNSIWNDDGDIDIKYMLQLESEN